MAWKGETEILSYGISHKGMCPLLKQWRKVAKGKATAESGREARGPGGDINANSTLAQDVMLMS